jgi:hypothetical protein
LAGLFRHRCLRPGLHHACSNQRRQEHQRQRRARTKRQAKTLVKVIIAPKWISPYIEAELHKDASERFNEYAAPMVFFLGFCVMPLISGLPFLGLRGLGGQALRSLGLENQVLAAFIPLISWPLAASLVIQLLKRAPLSRTALRLTLYSQAYCIGAAYLFGYLAIAITFFQHHYPAAPDWMFSGMLIVPGLYFCWFVYSEVCIIRQQLAVGTDKALGTLVLIYVVGMAVMFACELMVFISVGKIPDFLRVLEEIRDSMVREMSR